MKKRYLGFLPLLIVFLYPLGLTAQGNFSFDLLWSNIAFFLFFAAVATICILGFLYAVGHFEKPKE